MRDKYKELVKLLQDFGANFRTSEIFRDFVELSAIAIMNQYAFDADWDKRENRYHEIRKNIRNAILIAFPNWWPFWSTQSIHKKNKAILLMYSVSCIWI